MNVWSKIITALRGGVNEAGEAIVDSQALRILDQEVRDASAALQESKNSLAEIMARQKVAEERCAQLQAQIEEHEGYAVKALEKGDDGLALEVAQKIADLEHRKNQETESADQYKQSAEKMRVAIRQTEANLKRMKQQVDTVKATESVQRAQAAVAERHSGSHSKMRTAMDSLERIKEKQQLRAAQMEAASELAEDSADVSLQEKLEKAGIAASGNNASEILERLKAKSK
ncbi:MAG: PspA/IM30 family protein [Oleiphilaceae bacterium]|nr:PspA/IM30 family protein [Oleiphilaceae bacterium]